MKNHALLSFEYMDEKYQKDIKHVKLFL
jgi:hypothetical protein